MLNLAMNLKITQNPKNMARKRASKFNDKSFVKAQCESFTLKRN